MLHAAPARHHHSSSPWNSSKLKTHQHHHSAISSQIRDWPTSFSIEKVVVASRYGNNNCSPKISPLRGLVISLSRALPPSTLYKRQSWTISYLDIQWVLGLGCSGSTYRMCLKPTYAQSQVVSSIIGIFKFFVHVKCAHSLFMIDDWQGGTRIGSMYHVVPLSLINHV
jgi:hypothetical protein